MPQETHVIDSLARRYRRYSRDAFRFVCQVYRALRERLSSGGHVVRNPTALELCEAIRVTAIEHYGFMAATVLRSWGVRRTEDFGELLIALVRSGLLAGPPASTLDEFRSVFDFDHGFERDFQIPK